MPTRLVRRGRVKGYRPTYRQLQEVLEVAQKDFSDASEAYMIYSQGDLEISSQVDKSKILPKHVDEIIEEAGNPDELNNLVFSISQTTPMQKVEIRIGFDGWTKYWVESNDQTWAYGRYHELTDKLMTDRNIYVKFRSNQPEILKEGSGNKWRKTSWEVDKNWRELSVAVAASLPWWPLIVAGLYGFGIAVYAASTGNSPVDKQDHMLALRDAHDLHAHASILITLATLYVITLYAYRHWLANLLRSKVVLKNPPLISQFNFRNKKSDAIGLASFYIAVFTFIATIAAVVIQSLC